MRWPRRWYGDAEPDEVRRDLGRGGALARGLRQAATRDLPASTWQPGPVRPVRQIRRQARELTAQRADPGSDVERARTLARAMDQSLRGRSR